MVLMMAIYLLISLIISSILNFYNSTVKLKER
jgi:ABC-type amino acid transport system permease subunit